MSIQTALTAIKTANGTLNTLIGEEFRPDILPQDVSLPGIRYQVISRIRKYTFGLVSQNNQSRVQMIGYETTSALRSVLASAMRGAFMGYINKAGIGGEIVEGIRLDNETEGIESLGDNTEAYFVRMDFIVDLEES